MAQPVVWGAVQLSSQGEIEENLDRVAALVDEAAQRGARTVLLPENFAYMGDEDGKRGFAEDLDAANGPIARRIAEIARSAGVTIVAGGFPERSDDPARPYNTCAVFGADGALRSRYRKIHLFDVETTDGMRYCESASTMAGSEAQIVEIDGLRVGLSICYDLRFPELYRRLSAEGCEVIVVPAAFTLLTGKDHWLVLLRARAIEAQAYVVAAAQWGTHPHRRATFGKSCIIDPWGEVIAQASEGEGVVTAPLDLAYLSRVRARVPALEHRRL
ncbi:carbon-nitrogen hydrolase family protein [Chondromyces crocatus]|uniref:Amidohydrolase n=1 Tax=Chondromyces crocatus TaxID=52 RepID=A0A0K1EG10_CHOCO|nr:carbon-nitrogen hydrolase family protein [Chondromyces crocatus]AKT39810.1 amidohydrolase [Chondromyces crocatus]